jgi:hypothetical protein
MNAEKAKFATEHTENAEIDIFKKTYYVSLFVFIHVPKRFLVLKILL